MLWKFISYLWQYVSQYFFNSGRIPFTTQKTFLSGPIDFVAAVARGLIRLVTSLYGDLNNLKDYLDGSF